MDDDDWGIDSHQQVQTKVNEILEKPFEQVTDVFGEIEISKVGEEFINQNGFLIDEAIVDLEQLIQEDKVNEEGEGQTITENKHIHWEFQHEKESKISSHDQKQIEAGQRIERGIINLGIISNEGHESSKIAEKRNLSSQEVKFEDENTFTRRNTSPYRRRQYQFSNNRKNYNKNRLSYERFQQSLPVRRRGRPECNISIYSTRMSLTMRRIGQFKSSFLILPYRTLKLEIYPGSWVIQSKINYRERLRQKNIKDGECYLQRVKDIDPITGVGFIKIGQEKPEEDYLNGLESAFINLRKINESVKSVVISWDQGLGDALKTLNKIAEQLQRFQHRGETLREVSLNTVQPHLFSLLVKAYQRFTWSSFEEEGLWID